MTVYQDENVVSTTATAIYDSVDFVLDIVKSGFMFLLVFFTLVLEFFDNLLRGFDNDVLSGTIQATFGIDPLGRSYYREVREMIVTDVPEAFEGLYEMAATATDPDLYEPTQPVTVESIFDKLGQIILDVIMFIITVVLASVQYFLRVVDDSLHVPTPKDPAGGA